MTGLRLTHPGQLVALAFAVVIAGGTVLLSLPAATASGTPAPVVDALFTATSAVCVTGLVVVETSTYWSGFGQAVILLLVQLGGLGIMTFASLVAIVLFDRMGLQTRSAVQAEMHTVSARDLRGLVRRIVVFSLISEALIAGVLLLRFTISHGITLREAAYSAGFHAVTAFNNAGISLYPDSMARFAEDPVVLLTVSGAVILGGLGFPVVFELARNWRNPGVWTVLTRITVTATIALLTLGTAIFVLVEGSNPLTLGRLSEPQALVGAFFTAVMPRSGGFTMVEMTDLREESVFTTIVLMFIGGGSAGTAGGIKVTTFGLLAYVIWAEMRGRADVEVGRRRVPTSNQRQALAVALIGVLIAAVASFLVLLLTREAFEFAVFDAVSATGNVGLSTGVSGALPDAGKLLFVLLMFIGRIGPLTVASALATRNRATLRRLPEERTTIG
ncbi:MAG: TrkH family potassium uptake protein [Actinomycetales bacterium]|nr:TrkH family potassium uptake protein [Actinomycetales bacterium]